MATMNRPALGSTSWFTPVDTNWDALDKATTTGEGLTTAASTPSQITADQNDYAFAGGASASIFQRLSSDVSRTINGFGGGADGRRYVLINVGSQNIVITHQTGPTAANRVITPTGASVTLAPDQRFEMIYDAVTARWRVGSLGGGGSGASPTNVYLYERFF
jgi:hypothetical protein